MLKRAVLVVFAVAVASCSSSSGGFTEAAATNTLERHVDDLFAYWNESFPAPTFDESLSFLMSWDRSLFLGDANDAAVLFHNCVVELAADGATSTSLQFESLEVTDYTAIEENASIVEALLVWSRSGVEDVRQFSAIVTPNGVGPGVPGAFGSGCGGTGRSAEGERLAALLGSAGDS